MPIDCGIRSIMMSDQLSGSIDHHHHAQSIHHVRTLISSDINISAQGSASPYLLCIGLPAPIPPETVNSLATKRIGRYTAYITSGGPPLAYDVLCRVYPESNCELLDFVRFQAPVREWMSPYMGGWKAVYLSKK